MTLLSIPDNNKQPLHKDILTTNNNYSQQSLKSHQLNMHKPTTRQQHLYIAKISQKSGRYQDMLDSMRRVIQANANLSIQERNLLRTAFKNVVTQRRTAWRVLAKIAKKEEDNGMKYMHLLQGYQHKIKGELNRYCNEIIQMIDYQLMQKVPGPEFLVFYLKMKGDFSRYISQYTTGQQQTTASSTAQASYQKATTLAQKQLITTDSVRLGLALNFSVFYHQVLHQTQKAIQIAQSAFDSALQNIDTMDVSNQDETLEVMGLIKQNLNMWREDNKQEEEGK